MTKQNLKTKQALSKAFSRPEKEKKKKTMKHHSRAKKQEETREKSRKQGYFKEFAYPSWVF